MINIDCCCTCTVSLGDITASGSLNMLFTDWQRANLLEQCLSRLHYLRVLIRFDSSDFFG